MSEPTTATSKSPIGGASTKLKKKLQQPPIMEEEGVDLDPLNVEKEEEEEPSSLQQGGGDEEDEDGDGDNLTSLPPGRMRAVHHPRLSGSGLSNFVLPEAPGTPRSRSRSPLTRDGKLVGPTGVATTTTHDANSSISSLEEVEDILTDKLGIADELSESQRKLHSSKEFHLPSTVMERMTEDTLEDTQAFSDVVRSSNASRVSLSQCGDGLLEPLDECEEENEQDNNGDSSDENVVVVDRVILTNMENLDITNSESNAAVDDSSNIPVTGESTTGGSFIVEQQQQQQQQPGSGGGGDGSGAPTNAST